jgi:hypothetical protein
MTAVIFMTVGQESFTAKTKGRGKEQRSLLKNLCALCAFAVKKYFKNHSGLSMRG